MLKFVDAPGELLEESASLTRADFGRIRDVRCCLSSYNPHQWYTTGESSILSHMSSSWFGSAFGGCELTWLLAMTWSQYKSKFAASRSSRSSASEVDAASSCPSIFNVDGG